MFCADCEAIARFSLTDVSTFLIVASQPSVQALMLFRYLDPLQPLCLHQTGPLLEMLVQVTIFVRRTEVVHLHNHCRVAISHQNVYVNCMHHVMHSKQCGATIKVRTLHHTGQCPWMHTMHVVHHLFTILSCMRPVCSPVCSSSAHLCITSNKSTFSSTLHQPLHKLTSKPVSL